MPTEERQEPGLLTGPAAAALASSRLEVIGRMPYSTNGTFLVRCVETDGGPPALAVYKPAAGERPLWDFPSATLFRREVAAYELSRWLGWGFVPVTVVREDAPLGPGSLQEFVDHDPEQHYFSLLEGRRRLFRRLAFFDMLCNNADRKAGHCLLARTGQVWAVDHGLTFNVEPKLRTVIWDFAGEALPVAERRAASRLALELGQAESPLVTRLLALLAPEEVSALRRRATTLARPGAFPAPHDDWAFPWPLV